MSIDLAFRSFNSGEWSGRLDGRSDLEKYYSALRDSQNMISTRYGPAERRPGLKFVAEVKDSTKATRLLPFKFSTVQAYMLETGDQYFRFFKDRGQILGGVGTETLGLGNIIAHWKLNDDTTNTAVVDADGATHDGVATANTDVLHADGQVGTGSFDLDGKYAISVTDHADFTFVEGVDGDFSIAGWVYVSAIGSEQTILSKWDETLGSQGREWKLLLDSSRNLKLVLADESLLLDTDLIAHWKMNDSAQAAVITDALGNHDGTLVDGDNDYTSDHSVTGKVNNAIDFDGTDDKVTIGDDDVFSFVTVDTVSDSQFSISAWINMDDATDFPILTKYENLGIEWRFYVDGSDKLVLRLHDFVTGVYIGRTYTTALTAQEGSWIHVVATYDATEASSGITLYLNGSAVDNADSEAGAYTAMHNQDKDVRIGHERFNNTFANGRIDNVMLFDKELSAAEATALYNSDNGIEELNTVLISSESDDALGLGWRFVAATYNGQNDGGAAAADDIILYVDGAVVDSTATNLSTYLKMEDTDAKPRIGAQFSSGGVIEKIFSNKLDNIAVFGDVLTPTEVASLYSTAAYEISSPYLEADLFGLQRIQSADVMYSFHSSYNPRKLSRLEHTAWELDNIDFDWPPFITENITTTTITPSGTVGSVTLTASSAIFTSDHIGSHWLLRHNRTDNNIEKKLTAIATLTVLGDAADSYAAEGVTDILVDVKGPYRFRTSATWTGTLVLERSYDGLLVLVLDSAPAGGAWVADDIITGATSGDTCVIVSVTDSTHYFIKQLSGNFTDGEVLSNQSGNSRDTAATWPRYEGWHILETVQSTQDQNFNVTGNEELGDAYLRVRRTVDLPSNDPTVVISCERFYHYGIAKITGFTSATSVTATTTRTLGSTDATKLWSEGAYSDERGYPVAGTFHEERLMLAGTVFEPHRLDGSKTNEWENFRSDSVLDDDSISYFLAANEVNAVRWLISKEVLLMGTAGAEWKLGSFDSGEPLTPGNPTVPRIQTTYGSKNIQAIMLANIVLFVVGGQADNAQGRVVRGAQYVFDKGESGGYDAPDYTTLAEHITESGIVSMAYQQQPEPVLWCVLANGKMIGMTFEPGQKVWGWFPVVTEGEFEDVAVIPGVSEDEVWVIVKRTLPDGTVKRNVEYFMPRDFGSDQRSAFFVDSGLSFDGGDAVTITGITEADPCVVTMNTYPTDGDGNNIADGDQIRIRYVGGMGQVRNRVFTVSNPNVSAKTFELRDQLDTVDINSTLFTTFVATISGDTTYDSLDITNVSTADIAALSLGAPITGTGIPSDTTITAINDNRFTMSAKATVTATTVTITVGGTLEKVDNVFSGMGHLEGETVSVLGDGTVHEDVVVTSATITLTDYFNKVHAGKRYVSKLQPMKIEMQTQSGSARGKIKKIDSIVFSFFKSLGCTFGTKEGTETILFRKTTDATGRAVPLFTGEKTQTFPGGYELNGNIFVEQKQPLPLTVRSIIPSLQLYG